MRRTAALALAALAGLAMALPASAQAPVEVNLEVIGHSDLGGGTAWDDVAVAGTTAVVSGAPGPGACPGTPPKVVDLKDPRHPRPVADLPVPAGVAVVDLDATGDLVVAATRTCGRPEGLLYFDVTDPSQPRLVGQTARTEPAAVAMAARGDGRVVVATVSTAGVVVDDATDPSHPVTPARWASPAGDGSSIGGCGPVTSGVGLAEAGDRAVAVFGDGAVYDLDVPDPAQIVPVGHAPPSAAAGRPSFATVVPVGRRTLAVVSEQDRACGADNQAGRGLRLLALDRQSGPADAGEVRLPSPAAPGRVAASGELAFVAWHADGLRVVDLGQVSPRVVAQFIPGAADVVGVAIQPDHVLAVDRASGLYVLRRPDEGSPESLAQKIKNAAGFVIFPLGAALLITVPRLAMGRQGATSRSRAPVPARVPRRR
ncbi:MAG TPA: hypothetical protein VL337_01820 [Acidimicrobiales bacterium]|nr:hypothetical protein [Acidimicrobiales bacterium]